MELWVRVASLVSAWLRDPFAKYTISTEASDGSDRSTSHASTHVSNIFSDAGQHEMAGAAVALPLPAGKCFAD